MSYLIPSALYRPEIDGMRAVAVMAVVSFHAGFGVTGGYIGVDVFFVISGFLITSLIVKDIGIGKFSLINFWERRARRILPALVVVVLTTLGAGWFLLLPSDYTSLGASAMWQAVFAANIHFWINTGYFEGHAVEQPLLHTWSLAVEEQFYLVVPLLLIGLSSIPTLRRRNYMLLLFAAGIAGSLAISIWAVEHHPVAAFYLLPMRAWELLCGAFVALVPAAWIPKSRISRESISFLGIAGILIPCWFYTEATPFPGLAAVAPCFGTAMFILASTNVHQSTTNLPTVARILSLRPVVFIGLVSYSLYLWHWPLFAFSAYWAMEPGSLFLNLAIVGVSFLLAVLTWRYVETPFRGRAIFARRNEMFAFGLFSVALVFMFGVTLTLNGGFPSRFSAETVAYARLKDNRQGIHELIASDIRSGRLVTIGNSQPGAAVDLLLWGDSHAMAAAPAVDQFLKDRGLAGLQATASATAPVLGAYWQNEFTNRSDAIAFNAAVFDYIKQHHIANVILIGRWENYTDDKGQTSLASALLSTVKQLAEQGIHTWVMLQVPSHHFNVPRALAMESILNRDISHLLATPVQRNGLRSDGGLILKKVQAAGGHILDPLPHFMDSNGSHLLVKKNGISLYRDEHHLSSAGAKIVLSPLLNESLHLEGF